MRLDAFAVLGCGAGTIENRGHGDVRVKYAERLAKARIAGWSTLNPR